MRSDSFKGKPLSYWLDLLKHPDAGARAEAADVLRRAPIDESVPRLQDALNDPEPEVREVAADALGEICSGGTESAARILAAALVHPCPRVRRKASHGLEFFDSDPSVILPGILQALATEVQEVQREAGNVLDTIEGTEMEVFPRLELILRDGHREQRIGAIRGLVFIEAYTDWRLEMLSEIDDAGDQVIRREMDTAREKIQQQPFEDF